MTTIYCPICQHTLTAINIDEVASGEHSDYIFVHDNVAHDDDDIDALKNGIN